MKPLVINLQACKVSIWSAPGEKMEKPEK